MNSHDLSVQRFDALYKTLGMRSQRTYPNESCIVFVAQNWFSLPYSERKEIRILEIGCGSGANLWMLAKEGFSVYGLDASQAGLDIAKEHLEIKWGINAIEHDAQPNPTQPGVDLHCGSIVDLPYPDGFFDAVIDVVTLQHFGLDDSHQALAEIKRVIKPNGKFFSYRLSDKSTMFLNAQAMFVDSVTVDNINDKNLPLNDCGPTSFWSPGLVRVMYEPHGLIAESIESQGRTYNNGMYYVEYLIITAKAVDISQ